MVERQPSWDKYEAAILLERLLASMKGELTRSAAIKLVSRLHSFQTGYQTFCRCCRFVSRIL